MIKPHRFFVFLCFIGFMASYAPMTQADSMQQGYGSYPPPSFIHAQLPNFTNSVNPSYGSEVGAKALNGFTNILTGILEIPKNIINLSNQSNVNIFYGITGGGFKGMVHTLGRISAGLTDLITFPLPTKPIAQPLYIWDDFDVDTSYGAIFRLQERQPIEQPVALEPPQPAAAPSAPATVETPNPYSQDTNKKLDTIFKKEMMK